MPAASASAPVDFVAVLKDHSARPEHHAALLANCFAQSEALMLGKPEHKVREELEDRPDADAIAPQKTFPGPRHYLERELLRPMGRAIR